MKGRIRGNKVLQVDVIDKWRWALDTAHGYSVRGAYRYIISYGDQVDRSLVDNVWYRHILTKVSLFVWRLLRNRLPTRDNLMRRNILHTTESLCVAGCKVLETARHIFLECGTSLTLWSFVFNWLGLYLVLPYDLRDHHLQFCYMARLPWCTHSYLQSIWYVCVWVIWKDRNDCIFKNEASHPSILIEKTKLNSYLWMKAKHISFNYCYYD